MKIKKEYKYQPEPPTHIARDKEKLFYWSIQNLPHWYIEKFLKIRNKASEIVPLKLNDAQKIVMGMIYEDLHFERPIRLITLKARQLGLSTFYEAVLFWYTSTHENKNALIMCHEETASSNLFAMTKLYYEQLPDEIRPQKKYANGKVLSFESPSNDESERRKDPGLKSKVAVATAGSGEVGRSSTTHLLHSSETAFYPDPKTTMLGLLQSIPDHPHTMVFMETTANGVGDYFYNMWKASERKENDFRPVFLPWFIDPLYKREFFTDNEREQFEAEINATSVDDKGRVVHTYEYELMHKHNLTLEQMNWRKSTIKNKCQGDEILFMQEYPSEPEEAFISSGRPKFSIKSLRDYQAKTEDPIKQGYLLGDVNDATFVDDDKGYIKIWKLPERGQNYVIGADVAEGLIHGDYSCGIVMDNEFDIVASWHGHIDADLFGKELIKLAKYYNEAYLGVENNNHGLSTLHTIRQEEYWNIHFTKTYDKIGDTYSTKMGWTTSSRSKPFMIDKLAEFIREQYIGIKSNEIIGEMFTYIIEDNGSTNGQEGTTDDMVMATGIALQMLLEHHGEDYRPERTEDFGTRYIPEIIDPLFEKDEKPTKEVSV